MKIKNTEVFGFEGAFRGLRNPMNSWNNSDSFFGIIDLETVYPNNYHWVIDAWIENENIMRREQGKEELSEEMENYSIYYGAWDAYMTWLSMVGILNKDYKLANVAFLGPNDLELAQSLIRAGNEHAKFMRQIFVSVDICAPIYWWKEMDTYKVGTTANSTSTMHKLTSEPITRSLFEFDNEENFIINNGEIPRGEEWECTFENYLEDIINICESLRQRYIETKDKRYWRALIQILPQSWLQTRTVTMSYANLRNIYFQRRKHKLQEWHTFCNWIKTLPYAYELIVLEE